MVDENVGNQYGNGNVVTTSVEGNGNGIKGNPRCYHCRGEGHYASNCTVKSRKRDAAYLQQQLQIAQEEEARIQSNQEEFEFMTAIDAYKEIKIVKVNCTLEDTLKQASTSGTQSDNAPVYDLDESAKVIKTKETTYFYLSDCCSPISRSYNAVKVRYIHSMIQPEPERSTQEDFIR
nr:hypothetical protein [Tanacetum cinerariifolium]